MAKQIIYGEQARKALQSGIDQLSCIFENKVFVLFNPFNSK